MERYGEESERALKLFVTMVRCFDSVSAHARNDIIRHGLNVSEFGVLEFLYHKGAASHGEIAEQILLTTGSVTYVIDQLVKQKLVERKSCPKDRRVIYADLTEQGREKMDAIFPEHVEVIRRAVSGLSAEEQETITGLLKKLGLSAKDQSRNRLELVSKLESSTLKKEIKS